jgi:hypothetical protein
MFAWNMKYPSARTFWGLNGIATDGPMALPGDYQARLTVGGKAYTQRFALKLDPRARVTVPDLQAQFAFLKQVRDTVNAATTAIITIRNLRAQLEDGVKQAPAAEGTARRVIDTLNGIEDGLYQVRSQADEDALVYPPGPLERLSGLIFASASVDARPSAQMYEVYREFAPWIEAQLVALRHTLDRELGSVNAALKSAGAGEVVPRAVELRQPSVATGR